MLLMACALSGCKVSDQTTFSGPPPPGPTPPPPPPPPPLPRALVTIRPAPDLDLLTALAPVVHAAQARKPDVMFDIVSVGATADALAGLAPTASQAGLAIQRLGVAENRIRLAATLDSAVTTPEIHIQAH
jgi:hypothetical protein